MSPDKLASALFSLLQVSFPYIYHTAKQAYYFSSTLQCTWETVYFHFFLQPYMLKIDVKSPLIRFLSRFFSLSSVSGFLDLRLVSMAFLKAVSIWLPLWIAESKWGKCFSWAVSHAEKAFSLSICFTLLLAYALAALRPTTTPQFKGKAEQVLKHCILLQLDW